MKPLSEYRALCGEVPLERFLEGRPPAVLLHCKALDPLRRIDGAPGETIDRLALDRAPSASLDDSFSPAAAYSVLEIASAREPAATELLVGCGERCDLRLQDASVSRAHAWIERRGEVYLLRDNASAAGTQVNDEPLEVGDERPLLSGAKVRFGAVDLLFLAPAEFHGFVRRVLAEG